MGAAIFASYSTVADQRQSPVCSCLVLDLQNGGKKRTLQLKFLKRLTGIPDIPQTGTAVRQAGVTILCGPSPDV
jgi:hypothetical protein